MALAQRLFVTVGQARVSTIPALATKLPTLTNQLTTALLESLALPSNRKSSVVNLISLLNKLKAGAAARSTFLDMRSKVIHNLTRKIPFEGHTGAYIGELSVVFFTGIKHTADWYLGAFKENEVASCKSIGLLSRFSASSWFSLHRLGKTADREVL